MCAQIPIHMHTHTFITLMHAGLGLPSKCGLLIDPTPRQIAAIIIPASILGAFDVSRPALSTPVSHSCYSSHV